jgi:hypothetical protein
MNITEQVNLSNRGTVEVFRADELAVIRKLLE